MKVASGQSSVVGGQYGFEKLIVWQKSMELCEYVYKVTHNFPKEELFEYLWQPPVVGYRDFAETLQCGVALAQRTAATPPTPSWEEGEI
ncbi:MAG TPA: four helix bundle protein, partial [Candidatus Tripitaka sp. YC43]